MAEKPAPKRRRNPDDDRLAIPLDPEEALRGLLQVDPESTPVDRPAQESDEKTG